MSKIHKTPEERESRLAGLEERIAARKKRARRLDPAWIRADEPACECIAEAGGPDVIAVETLEGC